LNKAVLSAVVSGLLLIGGAAQAQSYVGIAAGTSKLDASCEGTSSCDTSGTGFRLYGGYGLGGGWAVELGYADLGTAKATADGIRIKLKGTALQLGGAYQVPLGSDWGLGLRLGVASVKGKISASAGGESGSDSDTTTQLYAGIGVTYAFSKSTQMELGFDTTRAEFAGEKATVNGVNLGVRFGF
jgi:OmpA-OmpF porin, OOP family